MENEKGRQEGRADPKQASLTFVATGKISMATEKETIGDGAADTAADTDSDNDFQ